MDKYKCFFLRHQSKNFNKNERIERIQFHSRWSEAIFWSRRNWSKKYYSSSEEEDDNIEDDNESEKFDSDDELPEIKEDTASTRKRKFEFSTLTEISSKTKDTSILKWLPSGDKISDFIFLVS